MEKNTIKLNESQLGQIIAESVKKVLNEISDKTLDNAYERSHRFNEVLEEVQEQFEKLEESLGTLNAEGSFSAGTPKNKELEDIYYEFARLSDRFKELYGRKQNQFSNFEDEFQKRDCLDM